MKSLIHKLKINYYSEIIYNNHKIQSSSGRIYMILRANLFHILQTLLMTKMENQFWIQRQLLIDLMITLLLYIKKLTQAIEENPLVHIC